MKKHKAQNSIRLLFGRWCFSLWGQMRLPNVKDSASLPRGATAGPGRCVIIGCLRKIARPSSTTCHSAERMASASSFQDSHALDGRTFASLVDRSRRRPDHQLRPSGHRAEFLIVAFVGSARVGSHRIQTHRTARKSVAPCPFASRLPTQAPRALPARHRSRLCGVRPQDSENFELNSRNGRAPGVVTPLCANVCARVCASLPPRNRVAAALSACRTTDERRSLWPPCCSTPLMPLLTAPEVPGARLL